MSTIFGGVLRYISTIALTDWLDIIILAFLLYKGLVLLGSSRAANLGRGLIVFFVVLFLSLVLQLNTINAILRAVLTWGVMALIVIFQPEIRRILEQLGSSKLSSLNPFARVQKKSLLETVIAQTVDACVQMSESRTGALIVFECTSNLDEIIRTGTIVDAQVSSQLLKNIFFVKAALHDGAVIVRDGRLYAAGCFLPLSYNTVFVRNLGSRHRAGLGISENSDAVVVIVSEETGTISVANGGVLKRHLTPQTLETILTNELIPAVEEQSERFRLRLPWQRKKGEEDNVNATE